MVILGVTFGWPLALLLLPAPLLIGARQVSEGAIPIPSLLAEALETVADRPAARRRWPIIALWAAWSLVVLAMAQPAITAGSQIVPASGRAMVLVMDLSSSMERRDFAIDGAAVDRLTAVKSVARDFIRQRQGDRLGLVLFGDEAFSAAPISYDLASISNALEESAIGMAGRATAIGDALGLAVVKLRDDPAQEKTVVLLSDGANNAGQAEPEDAARLAVKYGIHIHSIGLASEGAAGNFDPAADLDEETLKRISQESGGNFFRARTTGELAAIYQSIDRLETSVDDAPPVVPQLDIRNWLLIPAAFALAAVSLTLGRRRP